MAKRSVVACIAYLLLGLVCQVTLAFAAAPSAREPVTLVLANYWNGTRVPLMEDSIRQFEQLYPWIKVQNQVVGATAATMQKDLVAILGGMPPDVWMVDRISLPQYVEKGVLQPLDEFMQQDNFNNNVFYKTDLQLYKYKGKTYSLPTNAPAVSVLYYNRTLMAQSGYHPDAPPQTWDELLQMAKRLQRVSADGKVEINGGDISYFPRYHIAQLAYVNGSKMLEQPLEINYLNDTVREAANWAVEFAKNVPNGGSLARGTKALQLQGGWTYFTVVKQTPGLDVGMGLLPHGPKGESMCVAAAGWSYGIPVGVKHPFESWLLIKFLTTSEAAKTFALVQGLPTAIVKFNQDKRYFDEYPYWNVIQESLNRLVVAPPHQLASQFADTDKKYYAQLMANKESPEAVLTKLQAEIDKLIAEFKAGR